MSAVIQSLVLRRRAVQAQAEASIERMARLTAEAKGEDGLPPAHEWDGTKLRFQNPDGTWGEWVDLRGKPGKSGEKGTAGENRSVVISRGVGSGSTFSPADIAALNTPALLTDSLILERNGAPWRVSIQQLQSILGGGGTTYPAGMVTVNGSPLTVNGDFVTVT